MSDAPKSVVELAAKDLQGRWIRGYHITIAQVLRSYGDGGIAHPLGAMPSGHE